ncbi:MAG: hypothetical protein HY738_21860 [Bacteroidia bacterium]|nr:hypothetical protein [Bacteroidia bacterium]
MKTIRLFTTTIFIFCLNYLVFAQIEKANIDKPSRDNNVLKSSKKELSVENTQQLPDDFPKFINTGNPEKDRENYKFAKEKWIEKNPELYKNLNNKTEISAEEKKKIRNAERKMADSQQ